MQVQVREDAGDNLKKLIDMGLPVDAVTEIADAIVNAADQSNLLHEVAVAMPAETFARISQDKPEVAALLIDRFEEAVLTVFPSATP